MIKSEIQQLEMDAKVDLLVLDLNSIGHAIVYRFYAGVDDNYGTLLFAGQSYSPWPVKVEGFDRSGVGPPARPSFAISNVTGYITDQLPAFDDFIGAKGPPSR
jgi:lambda family phage minor tail protein L